MAGVPPPFIILKALAPCCGIRPAYTGMPAMSRLPSPAAIVMGSGMLSVTSVSVTSHPNDSASAITVLRVVYVALKYTTVIFLIFICCLF